MRHPGYERLQQLKNNKVEISGLTEKDLRHTVEREKQFVEKYG